MGNHTPNRSSESFPLIPVLILFGAVGLMLAALLAGQPKVPPAALPTATEVALEPTAIPTEVAQEIVAVSYDPEIVRQGQALFQTTCAACHGTNARGIQGLGKDLIAGDYVPNVSDEELHEMIVVGRSAFDPENTTGITMPPRGGNPSLSDDQVDQIIVFLRATAATEFAAVPPGRGNVGESPSEGAVVSAEDFVLPVDLLGFNDDDIPELPQREFNPTEAYALSCSGCHGAQGEGIEGLTQPLSASPLIEDDDALFNFLMTGETERELPFPHPVRGEYPALNEDQLRALIEYVHTLPGAGE